MEINAKVYAAAGDRELLGQVHQILRKKTFQDDLLTDVMEPCAVLPLEKTWYGFAERAEPTDGPEGWMQCLRECAQVLRKNGAVVVEFRSPDHPDDYLEYAYTTSAGGAGSGSRRGSGLSEYTRATGSRDIESAIDELFSGRDAQTRAAASRRKERKEAVRREQGDFGITADGVLKRYRGHDRDVVIPDGVREIGESAFVDLRGVERMLVECEDYDAPEMETLTIPDSVEKIGGYAFAYCLNLKDVNMADSVVSIGDRAFEGCESLKRIRLSAGLTEIEECTFFFCESLKTILIPEKVRHIRNNAFDSCSLGNIKLPEGLVSIGSEAFSGCCFRKVRVPESVTELAGNAFPPGTQIIRKGEGQEMMDAEEENGEETDEPDLTDGEDLDEEIEWDEELYAPDEPDLWDEDDGL